MMYLARLDGPADRDGFYRKAARLLEVGAHPEEVVWQTDSEAADLFAGHDAEDVPDGRLHGPRLFDDALLHANPERFALVYRILWRAAQDATLLGCPSDPDIHACMALEKAVRRDKHKMRAFLRFREHQGEDGVLRYVAWFEPDHHILAANVGFFVRRFATMRWRIITPTLTADYNGEEVHFAPGGRRQDAPADDACEQAWSVYFQSIFNPARLKVKAMRKEMPKKYWRNLPEAALIAPLIATASARAQSMIAAKPTVARALSPFSRQNAGPTSADESPLERLAADIRGCSFCQLHCSATQAVPGEGPVDAQIMIVAEQPGDMEDLVGRPLIGPAGRVFDAALARVGLERTHLYITNAVKHFKFVARGKQRLHARPSAGEIDICRVWLEREIDLVRPDLVVAMGATALRALKAPSGAVRDMRGRILAIGRPYRILATTHPSYLLRLSDPAEKQEAWRAFLADLSLATGLPQKHSGDVLSADAAFDGRIRQAPAKVSASAAFALTAHKQHVSSNEK